MCGSRKFCQSYKSRKFCHRYKWAIICWWADDAGDPDQIVKKPYIFVLFQGGGGGGGWGWGWGGGGGPDHLSPLRPKIKRSF